MKSRVSIFMLFLLTGACVQAQEIRRCSSYEALERQKAKDPSIIGRALTFEAKLREYTIGNTQLNALRLTKTDTTAVTITIPVVVHVVYNTPTQNISDQQVRSQIVISNKDFQRLNSDTTLTPAPFKPLAGKMNMVFKLADIDPAGLPTSGIVRKQTNVSSFTNDDGVKMPSAGGDTAWPASKYLNIWVCNLGNGYLGYTQFPYVDQPTTDGVVVHYRAFGNIGTATSRPYQLGRTTTHEIGHWLDLYHIWGDAQCGDDSVADTPTQYTDHNGQCPGFPFISSPPCANGPNGDMFMDYMDYTDDSCMNMFSKGQVKRMMAALSAFPVRDSLVKNAYKVVPPDAVPQITAYCRIEPNPCIGSDLTIAYTFNSSQNIKMSIYSIMGAQIYTSYFPARLTGKDKITDAHLPHGMYIVVFTTETQSFKQKIVVE